MPFRRAGPRMSATEEHPAAGGLAPLSPATTGTGLPAIALLYLLGLMMPFDFSIGERIVVKGTHGAVRILRLG